MNILSSQYWGKKNGNKTEWHWNINGKFAWLVFLNSSFTSLLSMFAWMLGGSGVVTRKQQEKIAKNPLIYHHWKNLKLLRSFIDLYVFKPTECLSFTSLFFLLMFPKHDPEMAESSLLLNITDKKYSLRRKLTKNIWQRRPEGLYIYSHLEKRSTEFLLQLKTSTMWFTGVVNSLLKCAANTGWNDIN